MSPLPDVGHVPRQAPGDDVDRVDAHLVARLEEARSESLGRGDDSAETVRVERPVRASDAVARLDLDEGEGAAAAGNEVDLPAGHARTASEDAPAVELEPERRDRFGSAAAAFGLLALHLAVSSSARA